MCTKLLYHVHLTTFLYGSDHIQNTQEKADLQKMTVNATNTTKVSAEIAILEKIGGHMPSCFRDRPIAVFSR